MIKSVFISHSMTRVNCFSLGVLPCHGARGRCNPFPVMISGVAIGYNFPLGIIEWTAPLVSPWLVAAAGDLAASAYYLIVLALIRFFAALRVKTREGQELE